MNETFYIFLDTPKGCSDIRGYFCQALLKYLEFFNIFVHLKISLYGLYSIFPRRAPKPPVNDKKTKRASISSTPSASAFNPVPQKSKTMKEKIKIFTSTGPEIRRDHLSAYDDKLEIKAGLVSEIIATFSSVERENTKKNQVWNYMINNLECKETKVCISIPNILSSWISRPSTVIRAFRSSRYQMSLKKNKERRKTSVWRPILKLQEKRKTFTKSSKDMTKNTHI